MLQRKSGLPQLILVKTSAVENVPDINIQSDVIKKRLVPEDAINNSE